MHPQQSPHLTINLLSASPTGLQEKEEPRFVGGGGTQE